MKEQIINLLDKRLTKLKIDKRRIARIKDEKKRHPAWKQIYGRILEVKYIRAKICRIKEKGADYEN